MANIVPVHKHVLMLLLYAPHTVKAIQNIYVVQHVAHATSAFTITISPQNTF